MGFSCRIVCDSITVHRERLTTFEVTYPRCVHAELMTHRMLSRNTASSRAIPVHKLLHRVIEDPFVPERWGKNRSGMQATEEVDGSSARDAVERWLGLRDRTVQYAETLATIGVHKQLVNRLLEPFLWHTALITASEFDNFFALRCHPAAQPELQRIVTMMRDAREGSVPRALRAGEWHLPLVDDEVELRGAGMNDVDIVKVCVGRCARISYLTHDGRRDPRADIDLCERLQADGHCSPFEHAARPMGELERSMYRRYDVTFDDGTVLRQVNHLPTVLGVPTWDDVVLDISPAAHVQAVRETYFCANLNGWIQARRNVPNEALFRGT